MASVSSKSCIISSGASSRRRPTTGRGAFGGEMRVEDLLIDKESDFFEDEVLLELGTQRRSLRAKFPPR